MDCSAESIRDRLRTGSEPESSRGRELVLELALELELVLVLVAVVVRGATRDR